MRLIFIICIYSKLLEINNTRDFLHISLCVNVSLVLEFIAIGYNHSWTSAIIILIPLIDHSHKMFLYHNQIIQVQVIMDQLDREIQLIQHSFCFRNLHRKHRWYLSQDVSLSFFYSVHFILMVCFSSKSSITSSFKNLV